MKHRILPLLAIGIMILTGCQKSAVETGLRDGRLRPCPDKWNCVCSQDPSERHRIEPLRYGGTQEEAREKLLAVIRHMAQSTLVTAYPDYIHVEFRSAFFEFVDDAEFLFDAVEKLIHVRSAARTGSYDFKVNRNRVEDIRKRFAGTG
jgi:uncharacterized protein (DUF1499 family)